MSTPVAQSSPADPELEEFKKKIEENLGAPVSIQGSRQHGRLAISFNSPEELKRIIERLSGTEEKEEGGKPLLYE